MTSRDTPSDPDATTVRQVPNGLDAPAEQQSSTDRDPSTARPPATEDTVEVGLADDLLGPHDEADDETHPSAPAAAAPAPSSGSDDEEDYLEPPRRRGKLTTGLLVALIFLVGVLAGTVLTKVLAPAPAPQVVYVLNDSGASSIPSAVPSATR